MSDLGALLRKAREQRGYTLEDVQEYTKIRKRYLEAIESGDYKVLPGSFYVRAFVKTYSETVGLDAEEVLRLYQKELPQKPTADHVVAESRMKPSRRSVQHNDRWGKIAVSLLMWAFPILIAAVIYIYWSNNKEADTKELGTNPPITSETSTPTPSVSASPTPTPSATPTPTPSVPAVAVTLKETKNKITYYDVTPGAGHKLKIDVTGDVWIEVRENDKKGKVLYTKSLKDPIALYFDLTTPIYVNAGRMDHVAFYVDETTPVSDADKAGSIKVIFTPVTGTSVQ
ncbi:helix-turn-helix domain-containing protein [Cohnella suwonensis]|uniref:Helix-turn-helix domain-containing protein n=1 Tax=Cohnella suwonensis TaxID=696072 RepID=A0ABW0M248_9BACL